MEIESQEQENKRLKITLTEKDELIRQKDEEIDRLKKLIKCNNVLDMSDSNCTNDNSKSKSNNIISNERKTSSMEIEEKSSSSESTETKIKIKVVVHETNHEDFYR